MAKEVRSSPQPVAALGQLVNWRPWTSQLRELTEVLPTLYATDALVAVERLSYWVDRLAALRTLAAIEARRQGCTRWQIGRHAGPRGPAPEDRGDVDPGGEPPPRLLVAERPGMPWIRYEDGTRSDPWDRSRPIGRGWWAGCSGCRGEDGPHDIAEGAEAGAVRHTCWH